MVDLSDVESIRVQLAKLCLMPEVRRQPPNIPTSRHRWDPYEVKHRASLSRYSDAGAWELISDAIMSGIPIEYQPPTDEFPDHAYVLIERNSAQEDVYIKIALCPVAHLLYGISFHYARY